jgi:HEAT repeat protein
MSKLYKRSFIGMLVLAILGLSLPVLPAAPSKVSTTPPPETEDQLIADLAAAHSDQVITEAMTKLERMYNKDVTRTNAIPALKLLLADNRSPVRRKSARILGIFHAELNDAELKLVCAQLKSGDWGEVDSGLKALRDLNASATVPDILPCLTSSNPNVIRDACRTLAVLGNKDVIPSIEPLLKHSRADVRKDAQDAIDKLQVKP